MEYPDISTLRDIFPDQLLSHIKTVYINCGRSLQRTVHILVGESSLNNDNTSEMDSDTTTENLPVLRGNNMTLILSIIL